MQKKQEIKTLLEMANHDASFAINEALKTEGVIDLVEEEATARFADNVMKNGKYEVNQDKMIPNKNSVTDWSVHLQTQYIDFLNWRKPHKFEYEYRDDRLTLQQMIVDPHDDSAGGQIRVTIRDEQGRILQTPPKRMAGPSRIVLGYVNEPSLLPFSTSHQFPVVSVEELKW